MSRSDYKDFYVFSFIAGSRRYRRYNETLSQFGLRLLGTGQMWLVKAA